MSFLTFLGDVTVTPKAKTPTAKKERNPVTAEIRIFKNGSVFPSAAATQKWSLEYAAQNSNLPGFGFDVIDGRQWVNVKTSVPALFISPVRRDNGKVDLFAQCAFDEQGNPATSVLEQGAATFGKKLLQMIKEVYNVEPNEEGYIDMLIIEDAALQATLNNQFKGVFHFPKTVSRGDKQGQLSYTRRENAIVYGFAPASLFANNHANISSDATEATGVTGSKVTA